MTTIGPSPATHGFGSARGIKALIPRAYSLILRDLVSNRRMGQQLEFSREGWTFHGKGIWFTPSAQEGGGGAVEVTVAGSSNFGHRSTLRDFESQLIILSSSGVLSQTLADERQRLLERSRVVPIEAWGPDGDRRLAWHDEALMIVITRAVKGLL
jgi:CDP-diacylglycerol---glycerol-3-phosphate 3-phosphatidyltransferase